jgi:hypothetical protein
LLVKIREITLGELIFRQVSVIWNHCAMAFGHWKGSESLEAVASEAEEQNESGRDFHNDSDCRKVTEL